MGWGSCRVVRVRVGPADEERDPSGRAEGIQVRVRPGAPVLPSRRAADRHRVGSVGSIRLCPSLECGNMSEGAGGRINVTEWKCFLGAISREVAAATGLT
jgi:hypothetical protein